MRKTKLRKNVVKAASSRKGATAAKPKAKKIKKADKFEAAPTRKKKVTKKKVGRPRKTADATA